MLLPRTHATIRRLAAALGLAALLGALAGSCSSKGTSTSPGAATRTYLMGFSGVPPRADLALAIQSIDLWSQRADAALILNEPPWDSLLAGIPPDALIRRDQLGLAGYYRSKGLRIVVSIDPTNGLDRSSDSAPLVAAGRSLAEPAIRQLFRDYAVAMDTLVRPDYLGLASETNLVRWAAPPALYAAVVQAAAAAAADVRARDASVRLFSTVQVETAWGRLPPTGVYEGVAQDRADFAFIQALGLSSYPFLAGFAEPESVSLDYYARLTDGAPLPVLVVEGGWTSDSVSGVASSPERQRRYIARHAQILDRAAATAWFQITFTDLDLTGVPLPPGSILPLFAHLGLVDADLAPKPALAEWDAVFARRRR